MPKLRRPCDNCPWRVDAPRRHWDPTHFASIWQTCQDDGDHIMLCHKTNNQTEQERAATELVCQGWLRVMGREAIGVRIALMTGRVTFKELEDTKGPKLFESFEDMLKANKIPIPKRNKYIPAHQLLRGRMGKR